MKLDAIDHQILNALQQNARAKLTDIGKEINKPPSTVFDRMKKYERDGVITAYEARLNPEKVDKGFTAFILGQAKLGKNINLDSAGMDIAKIPEVLEVHFVTGEYDYLIKLRVKDQKEYYEIVQKVAEHFGGRGQGIISPKTFKESTFLYLK
jgi:DNA-binding Lrp family transcriptional regulator